MAEVKSLNQNKLVLIHPFLPPTLKFEHISIGFVFNFPEAKEKKTSVMFAADNLSKHTWFISLELDHTSKDTARVFNEKAYKHYGLLIKIVSDSNFCKQLTELLNIILNIYASFHPEADDQY